MNTINMNKKKPLIKEFPQKYSKDEIIPEEINIKLILKNYINKLPLLEKFASENIKIIKPKEKNLTITFFYYHDIGKHQKMHKIYQKDYIYGILDKIHPFKSIILFIKILFEKNLFKIAEDDIIILKKKFKKFKKIIFDSYEELIF